MLVIVSRTGGFAGLTTTWRVDVDAEPDTESWLALLDALPWADAPHDRPPQPDRFVWLVRVEARPRREVRLPDQQVTGPWRTLVDRVTSVGDAERRAPGTPGA